MCDIIRDLLYLARKWNPHCLCLHHNLPFLVFRCQASLQIFLKFTHFPDLFPFKMSPCHPTLALQLSSIETTCFRKRKIHPFKKKWEKTDTYDPPTWLDGQAKCNCQGVTFSERIGHALLPLHKVASGLLPARRAQEFGS